MKTPEKIKVGKDTYVLASSNEDREMERQNEKAYELNLPKELKKRSDKIYNDAVKLLKKCIPSKESDFDSAWDNLASQICEQERQSGREWKGEWGWAFPSYLDDDCAKSILSEFGLILSKEGYNIKVMWNDDIYNEDGSLIEDVKAQAVVGSVVYKGQKYVLAEIDDETKQNAMQDHYEFLDQLYSVFSEQFRDKRFNKLIAEVNESVEGLQKLAKKAEKHAEELGFAQEIKKYQKVLEKISSASDSLFLAINPGKYGLINMDELDDDVTSAEMELKEFRRWISMKEK